MASSTQGIRNLKIIDAIDVDYLITETDGEILVAVKGLTAPRTITLPAPTQGYREITVKDQSNSAGANTITVNISGGSNIDTVLSAVYINVNNGSVNFYMKDSAWFTVD